ncbi:caspase recruitment domain-containing protein 8-like isoform X1 [Strix uralensis]|uniref:caspase recruitment domain-containing protein 8-like isoform X1 n=1 Tax=Strix uralensis TaxID=36305 RepID=UPI003DA6D50E
MAEKKATAEREPAADSPSEFSIFIKSWFGKTFVIPVTLDTSVSELKAKLNAQDSSLVPEMGRLIYCGRQLEDEQTLRYYKIEHESCLHHVERLRGGGEDLKLPVTELVTQGPVYPRSLSEEALKSAEETRHRLKLGSLPWKNCGCVGEVRSEMMPTITLDVSEDRTVYCARLWRPGTFRCSITGLAFVVNSAVTITYSYATWNAHLSEADQEMWVPAGPLFRIQVQRGVVQAVELPHFMCLAGHVDTSLCSIAHFKSGKMTLEKPDRVIAFSATLSNPNFSLLGVVWRKLRSTLNSIPVHSLVLIFHQLRAADTTLHLYLIPDDKSLKEAIEQQEKNWNSKLIPKPPPFNRLFFGCTYRVICTNSVEIMPEEHFPFCYKSPKEQQLFVEIYIKNMTEEVGFFMIDTRDETVVWRASLRSGDIALPVSKALSGAAFMKKHKTNLCSRMMQLSTILLHLRDANVINSDEEEEVKRQDTRQRKNQVLLELAEKKGVEAQEQLYQVLRMKDPYLISDLEKSTS